MSDIRCYLDSCFDPDHAGCVVYSCEIDGAVSWESHVPDDEHLLTRFNGSYDTFDRRTGQMLSAADYPAALALEEDGDPLTNPASLWKPWTWFGR